MQQLNQVSPVEFDGYFFSITTMKSNDNTIFTNMDGMSTLSSVSPRFVFYFLLFFLLCFKNCYFISICKRQLGAAHNRYLYLQCLRPVVTTTAWRHVPYHYLSPYVLKKGVCRTTFLVGNRPCRTTLKFVATGLHLKEFGKKIRIFFLDFFSGYFPKYLFWIFFHF